MMYLQFNGDFRNSPFRSGMLAWRDGGRSAVERHQASTCVAHDVTLRTIMVVIVLTILRAAQLERHNPFFPLETLV